MVNPKNNVIGMMLQEECYKHAFFIIGQDFNWKRYMWKAVCNHLHVAAVTTTAVLAILKSSGVMMDTLWKSQPFFSLYFENSKITEDYLSTLMIARTLHTAISSTSAMAMLQWQSKPR